MSKQTAVEWLVEQINPDMKTMQGNIIQDLLEQAKAMEREQIIEAHGIKREHDIQNGVDFWHVKHGEAYYNETYKGGEQ